MRRVVKPLEGLLISHKRIVIKDSAVRGRGQLAMQSLCLTGGGVDKIFFHYHKFLP